MKDAFSLPGRMTLHALKRPYLVALDFDGTLAPIVDRPSQARLDPRIKSLLRELSRKTPVAIVSGRSRDDLKKRVGIRGLNLIGNHGLEDGSGLLKPKRVARRTTMRWTRQLEKWNFPPGVEIEVKGYSLSIHYRRANKKAAAKKRILSAVAALTPAPRVITGKLVFNLVPSGSPHKGTAVFNLSHKLGVKNVIYVGDDDTDEDVFTMARLRPILTSIRVGRKSASKAKFYIKRQSQMGRFLKELMGCLAADGT